MRSTGELSLVMILFDYFITGAWHSPVDSTQGEAQKGAAGSVLAN